MAIVGQTRGTYNYNTLVRTNDGTAFEFNTNATVLFVDELPSGVTLNASFDSPSNPQILLREKVQLRFKSTNRIIFTPSASTSGTIRIFLFFDESNPDEFDMSFFSTEVVGTNDINLTQIASDSNTVGGYFPITNSTGSTAGSLNLSSDTTSDTTIFTVPANFIFLISSVFIATDDSSNGVFCQLKHQFSGGSGDTILVGVVANSNTASMNCLSRSFPIPFVASAGDLIILSDGGGSARPSGAVSGTLVAV
jgi:hypothetical protein